MVVVAPVVKLKENVKGDIVRVVEAFSAAVSWWRGCDVAVVVFGGAGIDELGGGYHGVLLMLYKAAMHYI